MQVRERTAARQLRCDEIKILVVAFDPVERCTRYRILAVLGCEIAWTYPERRVRLSRHHAIERVEIAVEIANGAEEHVKKGV